MTNYHRGLEDGLEDSCVRSSDEDYLRGYAEARENPTRAGLLLRSPPADFHAATIGSHFRAVIDGQAPLPDLGQRFTLLEVD